jgi:2-haloacid dehalogenase
MGAIFVFDAYGTLFDVHSAVARHRDRVGDQADRLSELWRTKQLEYSWVRTLAAAPYRDFRDLTRDALDFALIRFPAHDSTVRDALLAAYESLDPFPDAAPALARLKQSGGRTAILSNGSASMLAGALSGSGLGPLVDATLSVDLVGRYKTAAEAYALVGEAFACGPGDVWFHSSNRWDIAGARLAGFATVWVNRLGAPEEYPDCPPDLVVASLSELRPPARA